jgi:hypothetical protein
MDLLELPAGRVPDMHTNRFLETSGSSSGPGYTALV